VHRARFLEGLIELIPPNIAEFGKNLVSISEIPSTSELCLAFSDGTTATAGAIIACDGIKSVARQKYVLSDLSDLTVLRPVATGEVAYRGMFTHDKFLDIVGKKIETGKGTLFCGPQSYVVMYPVEKGSMMNMVAIKRLPESASQAHEKTWIESVSTETMLSDFREWGAPIKSLLAEFKSSQRWALYDHLPAPTYVKGKVALMGDAAHATTPHQGQGAGMAFEDSLILSNILGQVLGKTTSAASSVSGKEKAKASTFNQEIESCFNAYDAVRRVRTQKVTSTSREMGEILGFVGEGIGRDFAQIKANLDTRMDWIWDVNLPGEISRGICLAKASLTRCS
jgi:salicylate hydroxylase